MSNSLVVIFACFTLILPAFRPVISVKLEQEMLLEVIKSQLEALKYALDLIITRTELLENKIEELRKPMIVYNKHAFNNCENSNQEEFFRLINDVILNKRNPNLNISQIETTTTATATATQQTSTSRGEMEYSTPETATNDNDDEIKDILNEVLNKQISLETVFQLILERSEKDGGAEFIKAQFDDLKNFIKTENEKVVEEEELPLHDKHLNCLQNCDDSEKIYESCDDAMAANRNNEGVYLFKIKNSDLEPFYAYCNTYDAHNWMIIQRREDGTENFFRNWHDYKSGFGNVYNEYWIGLDRLNAITSNGSYELLIVLDDYYKRTLHAKYSEFNVGNEENGYVLKLGGFKGDAFDALAYHNGMKFSTYDRDNDISDKNCAQRFKGAWWYGNCFYSNLNGRYFSFADQTTPDGITWHDSNCSKRKVYMAIR